MTRHELLECILNVYVCNEAEVKTAFLDMQRYRKSVFVHLLLKSHLRVYTVAKRWNFLKIKGDFLEPYSKSPKPRSSNSLAGCFYVH